MTNISIRTILAIYAEGLYYVCKGVPRVPEHAGNQHVCASELHSIIKPWPFRGRALDVIGEIRPTSSKGHRFILVGIDYFTKWIKVVPLHKVNQQSVISFIQNHIPYRLGFPKRLLQTKGQLLLVEKWLILLTT
jgi:hypothetical protein